MSNQATIARATETGTAPARVRISEPDYADIRDFLFEEAALLDARRYDAWLVLLTPDIEYRVTAGVVRAASDEPRNFLVLDDRRADIEMRIKQISNPKLTFSENPPPFIRRLIGNIRATVGGEGTFAVDSYLLMVRRDGNSLEQFLISALRRDVIRRHDGDLRLARREVQLDLSVVDSANLPTFF